MSVFSQAVISTINSIPSGRVVSYGQIAASLGKPGAARQVGWILRLTQDAPLPWWRVINNQGQISIKANFFHDAVEQRQLLRQEGVEVSEDFKVDIDKYRHQLGNL